MRRRTHSATVLVVLAVAITGCGSGSVPTAAAPASPEVTSPTPTPSASPAATPTASPSPTPPPTPAYDVAAVQRTLAGLKYYNGPIDGAAGASFSYAVVAFQKVQGLGADGVVGPLTLAALAAPKAPVLQASSPATRLEVDLTRQVLYVVKGGALQRIVPVSSGNGATYSEQDGSTARALTPVGSYTISRRVVGEDKAPLGILYDPQYFYQGWAIHGSDSVPAYPASHGCVRIPRPDARWLLGAIGNGTTVLLYGGQFTFTAGSSAAGTSTPGGDAPGAPPPAAAPAPAPAPQPAPTGSPTPSAPAATPTATASPIR